MMTVRPPAVAGMFYTANPKALGKEIDTMLSKATVKPLKGSIVALIVPHAGYLYSGLTAAHAYKSLRGLSFETVVIISPSHREYFKGISIYDGSAYLTPLGNLTIDETLREEILKNEKIITASDIGHTTEHAIEVQLPFLQTVLKDFKILPIVMGDQCHELCFHLGNKLGETLRGKNVLVVASSDLSHYHPYDEAEKLDKIIADDIRQFDYEKLMEDLENERAEACGGGPVAAALIAAKKLNADCVEILHKCNSGDITGERDAVVGYLSAAVLRTN
jgi:hypothetical protein